MHNPFPPRNAKMHIDRLKSPFKNYIILPEHILTDYDTYRPCSTNDWQISVVKNACLCDKIFCEVNCTRDTLLDSDWPVLHTRGRCSLSKLWTPTHTACYCGQCVDWTCYLSVLIEKWSIIWVNNLSIGHLGASNDNIFVFLWYRN